MQLILYLTSNLGQIALLACFSPSLHPYPCSGLTVGGVYFSISWLWVWSSELCWPQQVGWSDSRPIVSLELKRISVISLALCFYHCHEKTMPTGGWRRMRVTWSRATLSWVGLRSAHPVLHRWMNNSQWLLFLVSELWRAYWAQLNDTCPKLNTPKDLKKL